MSADLPNRLPVSPDACVQKIDLARDAALIVQFSQRAYRDASFLDDRILTPGLQGGWMPLTRLIGAAGQVRDPRPLHFIFHTGHVGSTLISRLLDETGLVLSLREPLPLRTLADAQDVLELPESLLSAASFQALQRALLQLWCRGYEQTHSVVLKATSSAGRLAKSLLTQQVTARAIYLNLAAEPYIATLLAGKNSSIDLRGHGPVRMRLLQSRIDRAVTPLHALSPGEFAAMSWLAETWHQREAVRLFGTRVMAVDFDGFLADVAVGLHRIVQHFGLPLDAQRSAEVARGPVLTRYSKSPDFEYSPRVRAELLKESREHNSEEMRNGLEWLQQLATSQVAVADILNSSRVDAS
jgi:hypothetical protein